MLFVPDFVVTLTAPEEVSSVDMSRLDWPIWNSWIALAGCRWWWFQRFVGDIHAIDLNPSGTGRNGLQRN
jgi:hypothetical protein